MKGYNQSQPLGPIKEITNPLIRNRLLKTSTIELGG